MNSSTLLIIKKVKIIVFLFPFSLFFFLCSLQIIMTWFDYLPELSPVTTPAASHIVNVIKKAMTSTIINILLYALRYEWVKSANNVSSNWWSILPLLTFVSPSFCKKSWNKISKWNKCKYHQKWKSWDHIEYVSCMINFSN